MSTYTFETAWIVAHLQNNANERLKQAIRERLPEHRSWWCSAGRNARENFETFCWAWQNDCLAHRMPRPAANPFPFKPGANEMTCEIDEDLECEGAPEVLTPADIAERQSALDALNEGYRYPDETEVPW